MPTINTLFTEFDKAFDNGFPENYRGSGFVDNRTYEVEILLENYNIKSFPKVRNRVRFIRNRNIYAINKNTIISDNSILSYILLKENTNVKPISYRIAKDLKAKINFTSEDVEEILGIFLGKLLIFAIKSKEDIDLIVNKHLDWVFKGDSKAQRDYYDLYYKRVNEIYLQLKPENAAEKLIQIIAIIAKEFIELVTGFISFLLKKLANLISVLKIENRNYWNPVLKDGFTPNSEYTPIFIPNLDVIDFDSFKNYFKKIDIIIKNTFALSKEDSFEKGESYIKFALQEIYYQFKSVGVVIFNGFEIFTNLATTNGQLLNAFLVGLYNGVIEIIAGIVEFVAMLFDLFNTKKLHKFIDDIKVFVKKIKEEGIIKLIREVIATFIKKYKNATNVYDIAKFIGEDIAEISIEAILFIITGGVAATKTFTKKLKHLIKIINDPNPKDLIAYLKKNKRAKNRKDLNMKDFQKITKKMWKDFEYTDLLSVPPPSKKLPCFLAGTLVSTNKGLKNIENLQVNDQVFTYNFKNQKLELKPILKLHNNQTEKYLTIKINNQEIIKTTGAHRFWLPQQNKWIPARNLKIDAVFLTKDKTIATITQLKIIDQNEKTYNLEIKDNPNFFVGKT